MIPPILVTPPAGDPVVTLAEAKLHCRVDDTAEDTLITSLVGAATSFLDGWRGKLGRCIVNQTWKQFYSAWGDPMRLPFCDVSSVASLTYYDADAAEQTVDSDAFELIEDARSAQIHFKDAFTRPPLDSDRAFPIEIEFIAGFGAASAVPEDLKQLVKLMVGHWYENREASIVGTSVNELPLGAQSLIANYRRVGV
ncbi:MAG: head-tail connector protein [Rhodobacter sp.]|nr:head-tail connector protein [Rhodobacter sp.]